MTVALIWLLVFSITVAETLIATWEGRADRQSTHARHRRYSITAANWALAFEVVLFIDVLTLVREGWTIIFPIGVGAWLGKYYACERRRRKWWRNAGNPKNLRKKASSRKVSATPDHGETCAAPGVAENAPEIAL